jgi:hypothetical protein
VEDKFLDFLDCIDIFDFYKQSGKNRLETLIFLTDEIKKIRESKKQQK